MPNSVSWDDFRLVKAIADTGSLVGASDALGLNHSTVFRRLGALEEQLAIKLFERARTGYAPTAAGEEMIRLAQRMDIDITDFQRTVAGRREFAAALHLLYAPLPKPTEATHA